MHKLQQKVHQSSHLFVGVNRGRGCTNSKLENYTRLQIRQLEGVRQVDPVLQQAAVRGPMHKPVAAAAVVADPGLNRILARNALWQRLGKVGLHKLLRFCGKLKYCCGFNREVWMICVGRGKKALPRHTKSFPPPPTLPRAPRLRYVDDDQHIPDKTSGRA